MKPILIAVCLSVSALIVPAAVSTAEAAATAAAETCNTTCPVCGKSVDKSVRPVAMKPSDEARRSNAGIEKAMVGCCSEACRMAYEKEPAKYEPKVVPQWQQWKARQPKP